MPTTTIKIKKGDTKQFIAATLRLDGVAIDLTGASVVWVVSKAAVVRKNATVTNAVNGQVRVQLDSGLSDTSGTFNFEWEITFSDGKVTTVPNEGYYSLVVQDDLG